ncbi:MAG: DEAD/DEAH box helicase [Candidatus Omnitrophica bacterium]|nr:DEAD/DEAH box helicase [Candidatus Omnitrophota bacterium]
MATVNIHPGFTYDPFQQQAMEVIQREESVFVAAPTGAGKTAIAEYAIEMAMARGEDVIYTSPIKALSNQKFRDFSAKYGNQVGILTGDVSLNPEAPLLIMTTEIYRNTLFESPERLKNISWVIFDEIHYLDDIERGTVWEEAIMFTPKEINFLCLSATIPNVEEIASWIRQTHERAVSVIVENHRPVHLHHIFQCQGKFYEELPILKKFGYENRSDWRLSYRERRRKNVFRPRALPNRLDTLIKDLLAHKRLPCIYFTFGRRRTETLAQETAEFDFLTPEEASLVRKTFADLLERFNLTSERSALFMSSLIERGVAFHHAGMLPTLKEVIEQLFTSRLIKLIFTTETFALGINMPARTVVFDELRKFYGTHFGNLRTRDFYQMAGRAGRRGMDTEGFVYVRINPHDVDFHEVEKIVFSKNEPVQSQFNTGYATVLNLYELFGEKLLEIYPKSLHYHQSSAHSRTTASDLMRAKISLLRDMHYLEAGSLTEKGRFASRLYGYELMLAEMEGEQFLEGLNPVELAVILAALVYEPRKSDEAPHIPKRFRTLERTAETYIRHIHRREFKYRITPYTKPPHFHLADAVETWCRGVSFDKLMRAATVDEGELVRHFRMVVQLLRQLIHAPAVTDSLKQTASQAVYRINRDVVDAEKQLRA